MLPYRIYLTILFFFLASMADAQTSIIDGLKNKIEGAKSDEEKINFVFLLCEEKQSMNTDMYRYYVSLAVSLSGKLRNEFYKDQANAERAFLMAKEEKVDSSLAIVNALLKKYERTDKRAFIGKLLSVKSLVLDRGFRRIDMINTNLVRLQECEKRRDTLCLIKVMNSMGWGYLELGKNNEALTWLRRALQLKYSNIIELKKHNCLYSNTALAFYRLGMQDSAEHYINLAIKYGRETETLTFLANSLSWQAQMLMRTPRAAIAKESLNEALAIRKKIGDPFYIVYNLLELAGYHTFEKEYAKSIELCKEAIPIAYRYGLTSKLPEIYQLLADNYEATGNYTANIKIYKQLLFIKDSLNQAYTDSLSNIEAKYQVQKKENVIMQQNFDLVKKNYFIIGSLLLLLVAIIGGYFVFREYQLRHRLKTKMLLEEEKRIGVQAVNEAEEAERRRIAADLHDNLGAQANAILYSTELLQLGKEQKEILVTDLHLTAKDMLASLRETLWALKNNEVNAADMWLRVINFSKQLNRHYPSLKIAIEGAVPQQLQLSSTRALNIVFIVQEAVNNAVRHAAASEICIQSTVVNGRWSINVTDNGKGFDIAAVNEKQERYGLSNMRERAKSAGMQIAIRTQTNVGTAIELVFIIEPATPKGVLQQSS